jgi:beta-galactosidase
MNKILHGGDYNPEQWLRHPGIIDEDFQLFRQARINSITIGVFSWAALEPEEGRFEFGWMDDIFERAAKQGIRVILATPSGGKPNWLALRYPEVRRVSIQGLRDPQLGRHNHCPTSPLYREKAHVINTRLAERYGHHPALDLWHVSNEFGGYCYCDLCMEAFQQWLQKKYGSIESLNETYWSYFWSHTYQSWDQILYIDDTIGGLALDWKRFMTHQCSTFIRNEIEPIRRLSPGIPVTTNFMLFAKDYNYWELAREIDVISWDSYPMWHTETTSSPQSNPPLVHAFHHDLFRAMKSKPFLLMETTPSQVNWADTSPLRRPGVHRLSALQALAHGADSICYFQLRKSRGSCEQFHGAVIAHGGGGETRVFREVSALGETLEKLAGLPGAAVQARAAIIFDWECWWAYESTATAQNKERRYVDSVLAYYGPLWMRGIAVDVINAEASLAGYDLVLAPVLFLVSEAQSERLASFVEQGGTLVATYGSGVVDETNLSTLGGAPGPLRRVLGIRVEEFDALPESLRCAVVPLKDANHGLTETYQARHYVDLIHTEGAETLAVYGDEFYTGRPALTCHSFGRGRAYYVGSRNDDRFLNDFIGRLAEETNLPRPHRSLPLGVTAHVRVQGDVRYLFLLNFTSQEVVLTLDNAVYCDGESGDKIERELFLPPYGSRVLVSTSPPV